MEIPSWLKIIENLIGNLDISGWFKRENNTYNIQNLSMKIGKSPDEDVRQEIENTEKNAFEFNYNEKTIISKVNQIHKLNGSNYDFKESYGLALQHIKDKKLDWPVIAAAHMANSVQSGDIDLGIELFFKSFEDQKDPKNKTEFIRLKERIRYCYKRLQNLRHIDKNNKLKKCMTPEYYQKIHGTNTISDKDYQQIFYDFQKLLLELFTNYKIKIIL